MNNAWDAIRLPPEDDSIAPVTILDAQGRVKCVVSADEFRRTHPKHTTISAAATSRRRRVR
jgi:hypothetical protein